MTARLLDEVDRVLDAAPDDADARELFALLGGRRLYAVHYPERYGGRGLRLADHAAIAERVGRRGLPDEVHLVSVQGVGCTLLVAGTPEQRERLLPRIAAGRSFASLLLSEGGAGTDLAALGTRAELDGGDYVVSGEKAWNLRADWADFGLCSVRTRQGDDRYDGITLLIVPLDQPGVSVEPDRRLAGPPYFRVAFDGVRVPADALIGEPHRGWMLMMRAIGFERAGFDYLTRAQRWLAAAAALLDALEPEQQATARPELLRHERAVAAARALAWRAVATADGLDMDEFTSAYSKLACGEAAQRLAWWANERLLSTELDGAVAEHSAVLREAAAEAPELTVSGGASELQLDVIATSERAAGLPA